MCQYVSINNSILSEVDIKALATELLGNKSQYISNDFLNDNQYFITLIEPHVQNE